MEQEHDLVALVPVWGGRVFSLQPGIFENVATLAASRSISLRYERVPGGHDIILDVDSIHAWTSTRWVHRVVKDPVGAAALYTAMLLTGGYRSTVLSLPRKCVEALLVALAERGAFSTITIPVPRVLDVDARGLGNCVWLSLGDRLRACIARLAREPRLEDREFIVVVGARHGRVLRVRLEARELGEVEERLSSLGLRVHRTTERRSSDIYWHEEVPVRLGLSPEPRVLQVDDTVDSAGLAELLEALGVHGADATILDRVLSTGEVEVPAVAPYAAIDLTEELDKSECLTLYLKAFAGRLEKLHIIDTFGKPLEKPPTESYGGRMVWVPVAEAQHYVETVLEALYDLAPHMDVDVPEPWGIGYNEVGYNIASIAARIAESEKSNEIIACIEERLAGEEQLMGISGWTRRLATTVLREPALAAQLYSMVIATLVECMETGEESQHCVRWTAIAAQLARMAVTALECMGVKPDEDLI